MSVDHDTILAEISQMLRAVLPAIDPDEQITTDTSFRDDLEMESIDVVALAGRLQARYGESVNFAQFVAALDLESLRTLTVGDLATHIAAELDRPAAEPAPVAGP